MQRLAGAHAPGFLDRVPQASWSLSYVLLKCCFPSAVDSYEYVRVMKIDLAEFNRSFFCLFPLSRRYADSAG